MRCTAQTSMFI